MKYLFRFLNDVSKLDGRSCANICIMEDESWTTVKYIFCYSGGITLRDVIEIIAWKWILLIELILVTRASWTQIASRGSNALAIVQQWKQLIHTINTEPVSSARLALAISPMMIWISIIWAFCNKCYWMILDTDREVILSVILYCYLSWCFEILYGGFEIRTKRFENIAKWITSFILS